MLSRNLISHLSEITVIRLRYDARMYLLSLLRTYLLVLFGVPGLGLLAWVSWNHWWVPVLFVASIAAVSPWHHRWLQNRAADEEALQSVLAQARRR
jgi:hypothetical protein